MTSRSTRALALLAATAGVSLGVVGATMTQGAPGLVAEPAMATGVTKTASTAPAEPPIPQARPSITGPAPLPVEMQGVPG